MLENQKFLSETLDSHFYCNCMFECVLDMSRYVFVWIDIRLSGFKRLENPKRGETLVNPWFKVFKLVYTLILALT